MDPADLLDGIARGRTDLVFELLKLDNWRNRLAEGRVNAVQWFVYYNDATALRAVLEAGATIDAIDINAELVNASFFGHWKICDLLLSLGADPHARVPGTDETPLHAALCKAGRPHYLYTVRRLLDAGADPNATTIPGRETDAFMRDVRTRGETPLHRAAAYADEPTLSLLIERGANIRARDAHGDSPLTWASVHLRPGSILELLQFDEHRITPNARTRMTSDHGCGWGNGMEWNLMGEYLPLELGHGPADSASS